MGEEEEEKKEEDEGAGPTRMVSPLRFGGIEMSEIN